MQDPSVVRLVTIGISLAIGALALVLKAKTRSWTHPGVIFALFWCLMTLLPILGVPELVASPMALAYIFAASLAFALPAFFIDWRPGAAAVAARRGRVLPEFSSRRVVLLLAVLQVLPIICIIINLQMQGYSLSALVADPLATGCRYLGARYNGQIHPNAVSQAGTVLNYIGAPVGGLIVAGRKGWGLRLGVLILSFLPSLLDIFVYADKGTIFLTAAYFYGAVIVARTAAGNTALLTKSTIATCLVAALLLVPVVAVAMLNRTGGSCTDSRTAQIVEKLQTVVTSVAPMRAASSDPQSTRASLTRTAPAPEKAARTTSGAPGATAPASPVVADSNGTASAASGQQLSVPTAPAPQATTKPDAAAVVTSGLVYRLRSYAFGHLFAFSAWFDHKFYGTGTVTYADPSSPTWGFWTFMALGKFIAPHYYVSVPQGYFSEYFLRPGVLQTNIYTLFRGTIYDFTWIGSLAFFLIFGWCSGLLYQQIISSARAPVAQAFFIFFAGFVYSSFAISLLIWNSAYAAGAGVLVTLMLIERKRCEATVPSPGSGQGLSRAS